METQLPKPLVESVSLTLGRKGEGVGMEKRRDMRKESEFDVRNNTDIVTTSYNFVGDAASNASYLIRL